MARDPAYPQRIFAATWESRNYPWMSYFTPMVGKGGGIFRSDDGGVTWQCLQGAGWPEGAIGRIGLAVAAYGESTRIYAIVDSDEAGGLYRSDDAGASWQRVTVDPNAADTVYTMDQSIRVSHDGGVTLG